MKEIILITGANGSLSKATNKLLAKDYEIRYLTTNQKHVDGKSIFYWDIRNNYIDIDSLIECNHIIHLAGYPILKPWTKKNKALMYESRIHGASLLFNKCKESNIKPSTFISASAIGIYGLTAVGQKKEENQLGSDWIAKMASDWESSSEKFKQLGSRVVQMRLSLLLSNTSGFLKYNLLSMKYGVGIILGSKNNPVNWIHIDDASRFIRKAIQDNQFQGAYNLANTHPINQLQFMKTIQKRIFPYSIIITIPILLIQLLLGKKSLILNSKISVSVQKLKNTGFKWKYNTLNDVIDHLKRN